MGPVWLSCSGCGRRPREQGATGNVWPLTPLWRLGEGLGAGDGLASPAAASSSGLPGRLWFIYMTRFIYL